jgi:hypothetical protein
MGTFTLHIIAFLAAASIMFPLWVIYRRTKSKAELLIAISFTILSIIRLGVLLDWDIVDDNALELATINLVMQAFGYWWLWFSAKGLWNKLVSQKDQKELDKFREDQPGVVVDKLELGHYKDAQPGVSRDHGELTHYREDQPRVEADKAELEHFREGQ